MHKPVRKSPSRLSRVRHYAQTARAAVRSLRQRLPQPGKRALRRATHWTLHSTLGVVISIVLIFLAAHLWLPTLAERKGEVESYISAARGKPGGAEPGRPGPPPRAPPADADFSQLLLSQKELIIENGELLWLDRRSGAEQESLSVRRVYLDLRNDGDRHRLEVRADFPRDLCACCRVTPDIRGNPFRDKAWRGELGVQARALSIPGLPRILRERLPPGLAGRFDLGLTSQWRDARPKTGAGREVGRA